MPRTTQLSPMTKEHLHCFTAEQVSKIKNTEPNMGGRRSKYQSRFECGFGEWLFNSDARDSFNLLYTKMNREE